MTLRISVQSDLPVELIGRAIHTDIDYITFPKPAICQDAQVRFVVVH
jgi:hypothetical protein